MTNFDSLVVGQIPHSDPIYATELLEVVQDLLKAALDIDTHLHTRDCDERWACPAESKLFGTVRAFTESVKT